MTRKRFRAPLLALASALFLVLSLVPTLSDTAPPQPRQLPPAFDGDLLRRDLASWMAAPGTQWLRPPGQGAASVVSAADLAVALAERPPQKVEMFEHDDPAARREVLRHLPYGSALARICDRNRVDSFLVASVMEAESRFEADAVSPEGAVGLMQLLPSTGRDYGVQDLFDPAANLDAGSRYLGCLLTRFRGDRELAVAAYNAGPEVVARYQRVPPFRETQNFVRKVMASYQAHHDRLAALAVRAPLPAPAGRRAERLARGGMARGTSARRAEARRDALSLLAR
jgi:soluble lytic murein transglycosylase-like protein